VPERWDVIVGIVFIVLVLEATRRTTGWIMPVVSVLFIAYAMLGPHLPAPWTHRGYDVARLVGHLFITLEGHLRRRGGRLGDIDHPVHDLWRLPAAFRRRENSSSTFRSPLMGGKPNSAGRTVVLSSFLLGGPSGSGVATTVMIGTVAYPMMAKAGFEKERGRRIAGGRRSRRHPVTTGVGRGGVPDRRVSQDQLSRRDLDGDHPDLSLLFVAADHGGAGREKVRRKDVSFKPELNARPNDDALRLPLHLAARSRRVHGDRLFGDAVGVLCHCRHLRAELPAQGIRAGAEETVKALTDGFDRRAQCRNHLRLRRHRGRHRDADGTGLKFSSIVISYAGGSLLLTAIYTSLIVWIIGLAVPVTASYIICAVIAAPALIKLGVPDYAAHMFIFYYAVLSEVSPPTALSPFAAPPSPAAIPTRPRCNPGNTPCPPSWYRSYSCSTRRASGLLLAIPKGGSWVRHRRDHDQDHVRPDGAGGLRPELGAATKYAG
jgi:hypothetical protein